MNQQPDKFFREKLDGYQRPAPASAWDKIASADRKKKHRVIWLKIAASILPLMLAGYILWPLEGSQNSSTLATGNVNRAPVPNVEETTADTTVAVPRTTQPDQHSNKGIPQLAQQATHSKKADSPGTKAIADYNGRASANQTAVDNKALPALQKSEAAQAIPVNEIPEIDVVKTEIDAIESSKKDNAKLTLVYTASDVSQYLDKNSNDEATLSSKKPSTLQKLLKKANDLSAQDTFGELRQKKNEILALNFKGKGNVDKTSKQ